MASMQRRRKRTVLWLTLWKGIGKQPLSFTNHHHVRAIIRGEEIFLDLKYDENGYPCLTDKSFYITKMRPGLKSTNDKK